MLRNLFMVVTIKGASMSPEYKEGDRILALKKYPLRFLRRGQVVICDASLNHIRNYDLPLVVIKRISGLPHDSMTIETHKLHNSEAFADWLITANSSETTIRIPHQHYFLEADNSDVDSRLWGPLPSKAILGVVVAKLSN